MQHSSTFFIIFVTDKKLLIMGKGNTKSGNSGWIWDVVLPFLSVFLIATGIISGIRSWAIWDNTTPASDFDLFIFLYAIGAIVSGVSISIAISDHDMRINGTDDGSDDAVFGA